MPLTLFRFSKAMLGFLLAPEGGMPAAGDAGAGWGLKAGMQSDSARLEDVMDLLGDARLRFAVSSSNCTASQCMEYILQ